MSLTSLNKTICKLFLLGVIVLTQFNQSFSQNQLTHLNVKDFLKGERNLVKNWKYKTGDSKNWADLNHDDNLWDTINPELDLNKFSNKILDGVVWFRLNLDIDSNLVNVPMALEILHYGASEIYLNGKLTKKFGQPAFDKSQQVTYCPNFTPSQIVFSKSGKNVLAIKYSNLSASFYYRLLNEEQGGFKLYINLLDKELNINYSKSNLFKYGTLAIIGFLLALSLLHAFIFLFYREQKSNLYYSLFTSCFAFFFICYSLGNNSNPSILIWANYLAWRVIVLAFFVLLWLVYYIVYTDVPKKIKNTTKIISSIFLIALFFFSHLPDKIIYSLIFFPITGVCTATGILISRAKKYKLEGINIIGIGFQVFIYFAALFYLTGQLSIITISSGTISEVILFIVFCVGVLSVPISMSAYLAFKFSKTNKHLKLKLIEVENLSAITLEQERERKRMIESQKDDLEIQVKLRTAEVEEQKEELHRKNKEIIDSISYAKRIQDAFLPPEQLISEVFGQGFVLFKPKDIVSGDFYWVYSEGMADNELTGEVFVAAADCTGHGVPGAIMSVICCNALNEVVVNRKVSEPGKILDAVREIVISNLKGSGNSGQKDGMDIALCKLNLKTKVLKYAGANNPLWIVPAVTENQTLIVEIKADKMPVGLYDNLKPFNTQVIQLKTGDVFYVFSDGYADQFGGPKGKKFKYKQLEEILIANSKLQIAEQKNVLNNSFENWRGNLEQIDDVLIIGIKV